jgi:membrane protein implicated in regulation of membrane protease activity
MIEWFVSLNALEILFVLCATGGGLMLITLFIMMTFGTDLDSHSADAHAFDVPSADGHSAHHLGDDLSSSDIAFKFLSIQGLSSFFMMFGLVGLALSRAGGLEPIISLAGAVAAGLASVWVISKLFAFFSSLQSSGTIQTADAVACRGEVYLTIPEQGSGKVLVKVQNRLREYDAVSAEHEVLAVGTAVEVVEVRGNTLAVRRLTD